MAQEDLLMRNMQRYLSCIASDLDYISENDATEHLQTDVPSEPSAVRLKRHSRTLAGMALDIVEIGCKNPHCSPAVNGRLYFSHDPAKEQISMVISRQTRLTSFKRFMVEHVKDFCLIAVLKITYFPTVDGNEVTVYLGAGDVDVTAVSKAKENVAAAAGGDGEVGEGAAKDGVDKTTDETHGEEAGDQAGAGPGETTGSGEAIGSGGMTGRTVAQATTMTSKGTQTESVKPKEPETDKEVFAKLLKETVAGEDYKKKQGIKVMGYKELTLNGLKISLEEDSEAAVGVVDDGAGGAGSAGGGLQAGAEEAVNTGDGKEGAKAGAKEGGTASDMGNDMAGAKQDRNADDIEWDFTSDKEHGDAGNKEGEKSVRG